MKRNLIILILLMLLSAAMTAAQESGIHWESDFKQARRLARESGRPLLLDFTAVWCKPCQAMERDFWSRADVAEAVRPFVAVKIDLDKNQSLAFKYGSRSIPYIVFADPLGTLITFRKGFGEKSVSELNQIFFEMPKDFSPLKNSYETLEFNENDGAALLAIGDFYSRAKILRLGNDYYRRALKTAIVKDDPAVRERITANMGVNYFILKDYDNAAEILSNYLKEFPAVGNRENVLFALVLTQSKKGKSKEAVRVLAQLKTEFPAFPDIATAEKAVSEAAAK